MIESVECSLQNQSKDPLRGGDNRHHPGGVKPGRRVAVVLAQLAICLIAGLTAGCQSEQVHPPRSIFAADPCAHRLEDLCGKILLYYQQNNHLPDSLDDLPPPASPEEYVCPETGKPYIYTREGIVLPTHPGKIILYDAEPSKTGFRWMIQFEGAHDNVATTAKPVAVPESQLTGR